MAQTRSYSDLDFNFFAHPRSKDVSVRKDEESIKQSVRNLLMTKFYERPFRSDIGSQLNSLLFEPASPLLAAMMKKAVTNLLSTYEPRVDLIDVNVILDPDKYSVEVSVLFKILNTEKPIRVDVILERTR